MRTPRSRLRRMLLLTATAGLVVSCTTSLNGTGAPGETPGSTPTSPSVVPEPPSEPPTSQDPPTSQASTSEEPTEQPPEPVLDGVAGATGWGDPYYPESGNGGYDVLDYVVYLDYREDRTIDATTQIFAVVTESERLGQFSFDFRDNLQVSSVLVNDGGAVWEQTPGKLIVTADTGLEPGAEMTVSVTYSGRPTALADGTSGLGDGGWTELDNGGVVVAGEPFSASTWFPANEHPGDRATFTVFAAVPQRFSVIANGLPITAGLPEPPAGSAVYGWQELTPTATYLTTLYIDEFTTTEDTSGSGIPIINAFAPNGGERFESLAGQTAGILDFLEERFGTYPFASAGGIYSNEPLSFALETQTRPVYADWVDIDTVIHELAHQWYGDSVAISAWADICLNECFASYAPWLFYEEFQGADLDNMYREQVKAYREMPYFWSTPLVDMGAGNEFTDVYVRGPLALHALRARIGDEAFDAVLLGWAKEKEGQNASFAEWEQYVLDATGEDLQPFFDAWFHGTEVPEAEFLWPGDLTED